jgi:hypothetical protein
VIADFVGAFAEFFVLGHIIGAVLMGLALRGTIPTWAWVAEPAVRRRSLGCDGPRPHGLRGGRPAHPGR